MDDSRRVHGVGCVRRRRQWRRLTERYGQAPRAFLVAPIVGAFFIDFTNAFIITAFLNLLR